jgi:phage shock protein PspC (stress-responsive transcriptional regulator)
MEKIIQIAYQGRNFSIEESAYQIFQQYENDLRTYFSKEEAGEEIFADLQYRMAEILEQKSMTNTLHTWDIEELIETIGRPSDFGSNEEAKEPKANPFAEIKKKLFRDKKDKIIAGVCSGIANYFSIDPIVVRLIFVLFTIFNIVTLLSFNLGILAYIIFWVILQPAILKPNVQKKLFRNPKDKILGGVCSGIAQFFNIETWIVRLIFLSPLLLGFLSSTSNFSFVNIELVSHSFYSLSLLSYFLLWFIIPLAKVTTDFMLLKGEPININTIQNTTTMQDVTSKSQNGLNKFFKIIAYIIMGLIGLFMIPTAIGILIAVFYSYNIADIVLFTEANKVLALLSVLLFIALPLVGLITWIIRKILGYQANKPLRAVFIGLHILGWVSIMLLAVSMAKQNNTYTTISDKIVLPSSVDTLYVQSTDTSSLYNETVFFDMNEIDFLMERTHDYNLIKSVDIDYEETKDSSIYIEIEKSATGENRGFAHQHASDAIFTYQADSNVLKLPAQVAVSNKAPYYMQNVHVTIYVPAGKTVITAKKYIRQINRSFHSSRRGVYISHHGRDVDEDYIFSNKSTRSDIRENQEDELQEAREKQREAERENEENIREKERELREAKEKLEADKREHQEQIDALKKEKSQ